MPTNSNQLIARAERGMNSNRLKTNMATAKIKIASDTAFVIATKSSRDAYRQTPLYSRRLTKTPAQIAVKRNVPAAKKSSV